MSRLLTITVLVLATTITGGPALSAPSDDPPIFRFEADGFWLNLHHFLYVLGRAESESPDRHRAAVAGAPAEQDRGLERLSEAERARWRAAVSAYAAGPSRLDTVFDEELYRLTGALAGVPGESEPSVPDGTPSDWQQALRSAAPLYEEAWWPSHREANREWIRALRPLLDTHGSEVLDFVRRAYGESWPSNGYPVQLSGFCNWAGAYSTHGDLLVVSSLDDRLRGTLIGLEITFHEAMHQWDDVFQNAMIEAAKAEGVRFPRGLSHALLFFTAGEAVRQADDEHVPYAERFGLWDRSMGRFRNAIVEGWQPYLRGDRLGDDAARLAALREVMKRLPQG